MQWLTYIQQGGVCRNGQHTQVSDPGMAKGHLGDLEMAISDAWVPCVTQECGGTAYLTLASVCTTNKVQNTIFVDILHHFF